MYKLIFTAFFLYSSSVLPQDSSGLFPLKSQMFVKFLSEVQTNAGNYSAQPDLSDFKSKAQTGINSMYPGSSILSLRCEKLIDFTLSSSESLRSYFEEVYKDDLDKMGEGWIDNIISDFMNKKGQFGIMQWKIINNGDVNSVKSIAVLDNNWNVLYDTELVNFITYSESDELMESDNGSQNAVTAIKNQDSQTRSRLITISNGIIGSVQVYLEARITAFVPPYITAATNDAVFNFFTEHIKCEKRNPTGIPPSVVFPFLYFGTGGAYATLYTNAIPSTSPITITGGSDDRFNDGTYRVSGDNGRNWTFSFDFSVDFPGGSIGITPQQDVSTLSLSGNTNSSVNLLNYIYSANPNYGLRAIFHDGGRLEANDFKILTGSGAGEIGKINLTSKLRGGYFNADVNHNFFTETAAAFDFPVQFLRGDHVLQPTYQLTSTRYNIPIGQSDTLKAKITNNSHAVKLKGGNISIDVSSLDNRLTLLSSATISIDSIDTSASKEFKFVVRGNSNGIITPQVNISAMGWGSPVPSTILINNIASIDSNIDVSPLIKTLTLTAPIQGFYNSASNSMIRDTVRAYLRNSASPFAIADSAKAYLNASGEGTYSFNKAVNFTQYYIQTKHRNSIETWSKTPQYFMNSELNYDFSSANTQAYGDNLLQVDASPVRYATYSGDVTQEGNIDLSDVLYVYNDASNFAAGYKVSDINGDNVSDLTDVLLTFNNSNAFVSVLKP